MTKKYAILLASWHFFSLAGVKLPASIFGIVGAVGALNTIWSTFDFFFGVCVLCNLVVIFVMRDKIVLLVRDYEERLLTQSWDATAADAVERLGLMEKPEDASSLREGVKIS